MKSQMSSTGTHGCSQPELVDIKAPVSSASRAKSCGFKSGSSYLKMPLKYMGGKIKLLNFIKSAVPSSGVPGRWVEPFMGSGVVGLNLAMTASVSKQAVMSDTNQHVISLYQSIQNGEMTPELVAEKLVKTDERIRSTDGAYYYEIRDRFNSDHDPIDLLLLSRLCFNGLMRFNRKGGFNAPFCKNPERLTPDYIRMVAESVRGVADRLSEGDWEFRASDYKDVLDGVKSGDLVYLDPPYVDLSTLYHNQVWNLKDEESLFDRVSNLESSFILSTWESKNSARGGYKENKCLKEIWSQRFRYITTSHRYGVGPTADTRGGVVEALVLSDDLADMLGV